MSSTLLKILAVIFMLLDHIHQFIPNVPIWFTWIGRLAAPIFMFCSMWGYHYTHDRKAYLKRMYLFGIGMGIGDTIINYFIPTPASSPVVNDIFVSILISCLIVSIIETFMKKDYKKAWQYLGVFILVQVVGMFLINLSYQLLPNGPVGVDILLGAILPNIFFNEGSIIFPVFGVLVYFFKESKIKLSLSFLILAGFFFIGGPLTVENLFYINFGWMCIFSLIFCLLYNGKKGKGLKYFFYIFYPLHIYALAIIAELFFK